MHLGEHGGSREMHEFDKGTNEVEWGKNGGGKNCKMLKELDC